MNERESNPENLVYGWQDMLDFERAKVLAVWDGRSRMGAAEVAEIVEPQQQRGPRSKKV